MRMLMLYVLSGLSSVTRLECLSIMVVKEFIQIVIEEVLATSVVYLGLILNNDLHLSVCAVSQTIQILYYKLNRERQ